MTTDRPMQLGMVGLGRMGANMVRGWCEAGIAASPMTATPMW
jgi:6-phosphogluconate dehydrogenase (decarboxylating)